MVGRPPIHLGFFESDMTITPNPDRNWGEFAIGGTFIARNPTTDPRKLSFAMAIDASSKDSFGGSAPPSEFAVITGRPARPDRRWRCAHKAEDDHLGAWTPDKCWQKPPRERPFEALCGTQFAGIAELSLGTCRVERVLRGPPDRRKDSPGRTPPERTTHGRARQAGHRLT